MNDHAKTNWVKNRTGSVMNAVTLAMLPGVFAMAAQHGIGVIWNLIWLALLCCAVEVACTSVRYGFTSARQRQFDLSDGTTVLAAVIMTLCLPPLVSPAILAVAALGAIGLAKHAYGGLGQNIFNPAMVGYAVILLSFPLALASWPAATDGLTGATLLSEFRYRGNITAAEFSAGHLGGNPNLITAGLFASGRGVANSPRRHALAYSSDGAAHRGSTCFDFS
jgi:Na+-translocating ferredoxin:NAD+ oxidoreductase RnfD subunit